ncbi:MAG: hypothetical protein AMXMBFR47_36040 [Planctomycetota bacterium]
MRRLDPHCNINMVRTVPYANVLAQVATRTWQVNISRGPGETIWIEQPKLENALEIAVHDAERIGWAVRKRPANFQPPINEELWALHNSRLGRRRPGRGGTEYLLPLARRRSKSASEASGKPRGGGWNHAAPYLS